MTNWDSRRLPWLRHFSYVPAKTKRGIVAEHVIEWPTRGEADHASLRLVGRYGDGAAVSIEGVLAEGAPVPTDQFGRH